MSTVRNLGVEALDEYLAITGNKYAERVTGPFETPAAIVGDRYVVAVHLHAWRVCEIGVRLFAKECGKRPLLLLWGVASKQNWKVEIANAREVGLEATTVRTVAQALGTRNQLANA